MSWYVESANVRPVNTNVVRLYEMLDLSDPAEQIAYYDPGVGTFSAAGAPGCGTTNRATTSTCSGSVGARTRPARSRACSRRSVCCGPVRRTSCRTPCRSTPGTRRSPTLRRPHTRQVPNAGRVRHAVAIDEKRTPCREYLVTPGEKPALPDGVEQDGALAPESKDLLLNPGAYRREVTVGPEHALGKVHRMGWVWALLTYRRRRLPPHSRVHTSVRARVDEDWLTARG